MADFNQSPLGQASIALQSVSLTAGSALADIGTTTSSDVYSSDHSQNGETFYPVRRVIAPSWRRPSKVVKASA